jgi:phosphoglycerol transferase
MEKEAVKSSLKNILPYLVASLSSLFFLFLFLRLERADWRVPFYYAGDSMLYEMFFKEVVDSGWYLDYKRLGLPYGLNLRDYPINDTFSLLLVKLTNWFISDHALIFNLFYVMTYPLTTITSLYVMRQFKISFYPALLGSLLYTFLPYHLLRSQVHLFYSTYYMVPLMILVILWACADNSSHNTEGSQPLKLSLRNPKFIFSLVVCVLIASTGGVYYAFFGCYFLVVAGIVQAIAFKQIRRLLLPGVLTAAIFAMMMINLAPCIIYQFNHGKTETAQRMPAEAELYGLKVAQMILPLTGHRIGPLKMAKDEYNMAPLVTENDGSTLGVIGSIGFMILLGWLVSNAWNLRRQEDNSNGNLLGQLSVLNISAVLLGTIGGFSAIFSLFVSPQIRSYNRISIYIAFFALLAVALLLERARQKFFQPRGLRIAFNILAILSTIIGLYDLTSKSMRPDYAGAKAEYLNDKDFVERIEASLPPGAGIFQLPIKRFPETAAIERVGDYDLLKGYLHSRQLRWSYGAMRGRASDLWQTPLTTKPLPEMVETIGLAHFDGIYIDRFGYADNAAQLENELRALLETEPIVSKNERLSFFNLSVYQKRLQERYPEQELTLKRQQVLYPLLVAWGSGFSILESLPGELWRWCGPSGEIILDNRAPYARRVTVEMSLMSGTEGNMRIESQLFTERLKTSHEPKPFSRTFDVPPGEHRLKFFSDAKRVYAPGDPRVLVFRLINFSLKSDG